MDGKRLADMVDEIVMAVFYGILFITLETMGD
jgi:hypothetical protein